MEKGRKICLEVISDTVEAYSRKLQAGWTIEAMQDLTAQHGIDFERELFMALGHEIAYETIAEHVNNLKELAYTHGKESFGKNKKLKPDHITVKINDMCNNVGKSTNRGSGNLIICSPMGVSLLQSAKNTPYTVAEGDRDPKFSMDGLAHVGYLNGTIKVLCSLHLEDEILVGYKGGHGELDTGYVYAPYKIAQAGPMTEPQMQMTARYGKHVTKNGADYYRCVKVNLDELWFKDVNEILDEHTVQEGEKITEDFTFPSDREGKGSLVTELPKVYSHDEVMNEIKTNKDLAFFNTNKSEDPFE
jgi:hypothetical protein